MHDEVLEFCKTFLELDKLLDSPEYRFPNLKKCGRVSRISRFKRPLKMLKKYAKLDRRGPDDSDTEELIAAEEAAERAAEEAAERAADRAATKNQVVARGLAQRKQNPQPQPVEGQMTGYEDQGRGHDESPLGVLHAYEVQPTFTAAPVMAELPTAEEFPIGKGDPGA